MKRKDAGGKCKSMGQYSQPQPPCQTYKDISVFLGTYILLTQWILYIDMILKVMIPVFPSYCTYIFNPSLIFIATIQIPGVPISTRLDELERTLSERFGPITEIKPRTKQNSVTQDVFVTFASEESTQRALSARTFVCSLHQKFFFLHF